MADHFPTFPVLPGVLLLEGLIESASWLVREGENFAHSMVLLEQARNVKYKSFLAPGARIEYTVEAKAIEENVSSFTGFGLSEGQKYEKYMEITEVTKYGNEQGRNFYTGSGSSGRCVGC